MCVRLIYSRDYVKLVGTASRHDELRERWKSITDLLTSENGERMRTGVCKMGVCWVGVTGNVYGTGYIIPVDVELSTAADKISTHLQYVVDMVCEEEEERHGSMVRGFCIQQPVSSIIQLSATFLMTKLFNTQLPPHHHWT